MKMVCEVKPSVYGESVFINFLRAASIIFYWDGFSVQSRRTVSIKHKTFAAPDKSALKAVNSHKVSIFRRLGAISRLTQSHSRGKPYTFRAPDSNKNSRSFWRERKSASGRPANHSLPTVRFSLSSSAIGRRRLQRHPPPPPHWSLFPALWKSLEYAPFEAERCAAASNNLGSESRWRRTQHRSSAERVTAHPDSI